MEDNVSTNCIWDLFAKPTVQWFAKTLGQPTPVQEMAWPAIAEGKPTLVSAPTGTGKTLSAFLVYIDRLKKLAREGNLKEELYVIYVSPLKSLAGDIHENLRKPLEGITREEGKEDVDIKVAIRTGDTLQKDRQRMIKHPPHILIITPESLYLMLTSKSGKSILQTARAIIIDELHAMIDTKRGAHLMLSIARLDKLCGNPLQRIGLSATIEPLEVAARFLSPEVAVIAAPKMNKKTKIEVIGTAPMKGRRKDPVWEEIAAAVYQECLKNRSVIAFSEARTYVEKLAFFVNELGGEDFARVHHGSMSKISRMEVENELRAGNLKLLCATSSMELGIDVGEIDLVLQIGCPRTISSTMQRLGRAGHNPGRTSIMYMYPRTAPESIYCGMTAEAARLGGVEQAKPPTMCFDVLAQHLVSMATGEGYSIDDVMELLKRTYTFEAVTREDVKDILCMLAGDYEHSREIPVRPRVLYDRIHERVLGDAYSRMLAVAAGGTIPDKGLYTVKTQEGVKLGSLDEEFVYESRVGDKFLLGTFAWRILRQDKDNVIVTQVPTDGAKLPFWKGELKGRSFGTSILFGNIFNRLGKAYENDTLMEELKAMGLNEPACQNASDFIGRQISATGVLPDDKTIIVEHFKDESGSHQIMVHSLFGRQINSPLALLMQYTAKNICDFHVGCVDEEEGFLLYPYGEETLPEGLLYSIPVENAQEILKTILPMTPLFSITFRYNLGRALMMGMKNQGRQPLWLQRIRSTQALESMLEEKNHPLIRETIRECLEEQWNLSGVMEVLHGIHSGLITVHELYLDTPSPMSLPLQWQVEAAEMYSYAPTTDGMKKRALEELAEIEKIKPSAEALEQQKERKKLPKDEMELHSLFMIEGDLTAEELKESLNIPLEWLEQLAQEGKAVYMEPGLWMAAEYQEVYEKAFGDGDQEAAQNIIRRMLYYCGAHTIEQIQERYLLSSTRIHGLMKTLCETGSIVQDGELYFHAKLYDRARKVTIQNLRKQVTTQAGEQYAALMAGQSIYNCPPEEQLKQTIHQYSSKAFSVELWEEVLFPSRVKNYNGAMLDRFLAQGDFYWKMDGDGNLSFESYENIDWDASLADTADILSEEEQKLYQELQKRGASFLKSLSNVLEDGDVQEVLLQLAQKGLVCADSFTPVRQWQNQSKMKKAPVRQRVNARVMALSAGRWDVVRPCQNRNIEILLEEIFEKNMILCRETFQRFIMNDTVNVKGEITFGSALEILRIWEYVGKVRRGYFIEGMSGAQFALSKNYDSIMYALNRSQVQQVIWLNATDPAQIWGKILEHKEGKSFINVIGTVVALVDGNPVVVLERKGKIMRILSETNEIDSQMLSNIMTAFVEGFQKKNLFSGQKRIVVKEYPKEYKEILQKCGFIREMNDYVLYR